MSTITTNISRTLNGSSSFVVGDDTYQWGGRWLHMLDVWAADNGPSRTATFTLSGKSWGAGVLLFTGNTKVVINDSSSGVTDADRVYLQYVSLTGKGPNTITLKNAEADTIYGGGGNETVTIGYWASHISLNRGNDVVSVTGVGEVGSISMGRGDDTLKTASGWIGTADMGRGSDTVTLGKGGADYINLGRDADTIKLSLLADVNQHVLLNGGEGVTETTDKDSDTIDFSAFTAALTIDLNGQSTVRSGSGNFDIRNFENAIGGAGKDTIIASIDANILKGGAGADTFDFNSIAAARGDKILDFSQTQKDRIDLSSIDANTSLASNQAFTFIATQAFHNKAGELRYEVKSGDTLIHGDVNGDGKADFTITIDASVALKIGDFIL